jgi:hypothetical protein
MAQKAIIHTATRVIRRLTIDDAPAVGPDETAVALAAPIDLAGGPWKLDGSDQKAPATAQEFRDAGLDEAFNRQQRMARRAEVLAALADVKDDALIALKVRRVLAALHDLLR